MKNCVFMNLVFLLVVSLSGHLMAEDPINDNPQLSPAEQELISLLDEYKEKKSAHWAEQKKSATRDEDGVLVLSEIDMPDPEIEYIPKIMAFEEAHRGEDVGLQALKQIYSEAGRGGGTKSPAYLARQESLSQISAYAKLYGVAGLLARADGGDFDPTFRKAAETIIDSPEASPIVRDYVRYELAKWWIRMQRLSAGSTKRKQALLEGAESPWPDGVEIKLVNELLDLMPKQEIFSEKVKESVSILDALATDEDSPRLLKRVPADSKYRIIRYVEDPSKRTISEIATDYLFKYRHLQKDMPAPALEIKLIDGRHWKMADQLGKVVIIQFSFTGCGPCARMYPDLKELAAKHPEELAVLTIMRDETAVDIQSGIESGKLTWDIAWDGKPGKVTSQWSVDFFPTTYVIDRKGNILRTNMPNQKFKKYFLQILADEDQASDAKH